MHQEQLDKVRNGQGFIAALDQSGGSTPKALGLYGVTEDQWAGDDEMFDLVHAMRARIITSPSFGGERILGAILFEMTMDRQIEGVPTSEFLWNNKEVVPFLKVDKGLEAESDGVQLMKPMPELGALLERANSHGIFGTKMRSVIGAANESGVEAVVAQQFEVARQICAAGLVPIIEPEVSIGASDKAAAEDLLAAALTRHLDTLDASEHVMLKVTLPEAANLYAPHQSHAQVARVVALSGGYERDDANARLAQNNGMIASFSRALSAGLSAQQSSGDFDATLDASIASIFAASIT